MDFVPGEKYRYSNSGYVLLGHIIEVITKESYADFIEKNIFKPLGMNASYYGSMKKIIPNRASGYSPNGDGINDEFFIPFSPAMTEIKELRIYDRTGALVFEVFDIAQGEELLKAWDGEFNGQKIRQGLVP